MGKRSQEKGKRGEIELREILRAEGFNVERGGSMTFGEIPDLYGLPDVHIEVKRTEKLNLHTAMEQAQRDAEHFNDGAPTVFHRINREPWMVTMLFTDWVELYKKAKSKRDLLKEAKDDSSDF